MFINHEDQTFDIKATEDLAGVPTVALVATYNLLTGKSIKKFSDRATAEKRLSALLPEVDATPEIAPIKSNKAGRKSPISKDAWVQLLVSSNPKRAGSQAAAHWDKYEDCITVAELQSRGIPLVDIRWNLDKGFIKLNDAA